MFNHMVEHTAHLNLVFHALADATRRDILRQVLQKPRSISELALAYAFSFAAIAKHITVLELAQLVTKSKHGRQQIIEPNPVTVSLALSHLQEYDALWTARLDQLDQVLETGQDRKPRTKRQR